MALIERYIANPHFSERHSLKVLAPSNAILETVVAYRPEADLLFRTMIALREFPMRADRIVRHRRGGPPPPFGIDTFTLMERSDAEIVYGLAGRFWRLDYGLKPISDGRDFMTFNEPGFAKLALNFSVESVNERASILTTETRISCIDKSATAHIAPYWYLIRPVSGLIRRRILRAIRRASEAV